MANRNGQVISESGYAGIQIPVGSALPVRNTPRTSAPDREIEPPPYFQEWAQGRMLRNLDRINAWFADLSKVVEEYQVESTESATGETTVTVIADYSPASELIDQVLVTGPPSTGFTLQLGNRYFQLVTNVTGFCLLSPVKFKLGPDAQRILTAGVGNGFQETTPANPAAGANFTWTNTTGIPITLQSFSFLFTASSTAGNRNVIATLSDAQGNLIAVIRNGTAVVASTALTFSAALGSANESDASGFCPLTLWSLPMQPGWVLATQINGILAGDQISNITLTYLGTTSTPGNWALHLSGHAISDRRYT